MPVQIRHPRLIFKKPYHQVNFKKVIFPITRINVIPVQELTSPHLMAEYRELPRVFTLVRNAQAKGKTPDHYQIETYRLGKGHVWFFYKRLSWLLNRYSEIVIELRTRNYNINPIPLSDLVDGIDYLWFNWYVVTLEAVEENRHRIEKRLSGDKT